MNKVKQLILSNKLTKKAALFAVTLVRSKRLQKLTLAALKSIENENNRIFYLGIPAHANLGDLAQGVCIRRWLKKHYPDRRVVEIETNALVNTRFSVLKQFKAAYKKGDIIVFQSGYTTTDLGGFADEMHRAVINALPEAKMLMLPQTVFFKEEKNKQRTAEVYSRAEHMLFLARDRVSYDMAKDMFKNIPILQYPDIVTTLIGSRSFDYNRDGIMFCCRDDGEKYYSEDEIKNLYDKCSKLCKTDLTDTTKQGKTSEIVKNAKQYIEKEIDTYAHYKLIITDRYHGTILSLVAGTPVIIIKTTDHKVTTGAEWFRGVYDDYVYLAESLEQAYDIAKEILAKPLDNKLLPYFETEYYDKLPDIFSKETREK